jgi:hypothetical protein
VNHIKNGSEVSISTVTVVIARTENRFEYEKRLAIDQFRDLFAFKLESLLGKMSSGSSKFSHFLSFSIPRWNLNAADAKKIDE